MAKFTPDQDPFPLKAGRVLFQNVEQTITEICQYIHEECIDYLIIGLPIRSDGTDSEQTKKVRAFATSLSEKSGLEFSFQDEHLSTQEAKERMQNSAEYNFQIQMDKIDEVSAIIILEDFIRS